MTPTPRPPSSTARRHVLHRHRPRGRPGQHLGHRRRSGLRPACRGRQRPAEPDDGRPLGEPSEGRRGRRHLAAREQALPVRLRRPADRGEDQVRPVGTPAENEAMATILSTCPGQRGTPDPTHAATRVDQHLTDPGRDDTEQPAACPGRRITERRCEQASRAEVLPVRCTTPTATRSAPQARRRCIAASPATRRRGWTGTATAPPANEPLGDTGRLNHPAGLVEIHTE